MMEPIRPWAVYNGRLSAGSAGRISLEMAFAMLVSDRVEIEAFELPDIFSAPTDEGENDAARELVRLEAESLTNEILNGNISTYARPIGGGDIILLKPNVWELDQPLDRFSFASLNLEHWMDATAEYTHRILVNEEQFKNWARDLRPYGYLDDDQVNRILDPFGRDRKTEVHGASIEQEVERNSISDKTIPANPPGVVPKFLKLPVVLDMVSLSRSSVYVKIKKNAFPEQTKIGGGSFWLESEIVQWIEENANKRQA
ncbi:helix-turn-helix transcriptional regulator [Parasphingorhabdus sp. NYA22]